MGSGPVPDIRHRQKKKKKTSFLLLLKNICADWDTVIIEYVQIYYMNWNIFFFICIIMQNAEIVDVIIVTF